SVRGYLQIKNLSYSYAEVFSGIEDNDVERAVFKLREHIRQICDHFQFLIHRFEKNQTDCYFQQVTLNFDSFDSVEDLEEGMVEFYQAFDEKHHAGDCQIVQLFDVSKDVFKKMVEHSTKEKGFNRQKENIEKIEKKELDLSCTTCMKIGDTVIALECPEYAILLTHDKAFEGLCQIFDLKHEIIPSLRAEKPTKEVLERLRK
ncbi:MAG: hypothetical protein KAS66_09905, partial [Candidatus Omnitrophica bacterium]|nr:hypothetical protein [Candidatus Omnitrophota bacterium]